MKGIHTTKLILILLIAGTAAKAQVMPGGVKTPHLWLAAGTGDQRTFHSLLKKDTTVQLSRGKTNDSLNFHPAIILEEQDSLRFKLADTSQREATVLTVFRAFDETNEHQLWHIGETGMATMVYSNFRFADLTLANGNRSFKHYHGTYPKIGLSTYVLPRSSNGPAYWNFVRLPQKTAVPIRPFNGLLAELIAFPRHLDRQEALKVQSYLAIKYGITLADSSGTYRDSRNETLWSSRKHPEYQYHVAGLIRDDASGLHQLRASSAETPGELILASSDTLADRSSLLWGDNDKSWRNDDPVPGIPVYVKKRWLLETNNQGKPLTANLAVNTRHFIDLPDKPVYWLLIDQSGTGEFKGASTELVRLSDPDPKGWASTAGLKLGGQGTPATCIAFAAAGELLFTTELQGPSCGTGQSGSLKVRISGGQAPFNLTVSNAAGQLISKLRLTERKPAKINGLATGNYTVTISDDLKHTATQSFYLNNSDGPKPLAISNSYTLRNGQPLTLRADSAMNESVQYQWNGPNGFSASGGTVTLRETGLYLLECRQNGCSYRQTIFVNPTEDELVAELKVSPNPSTNGNYRAVVKLPVQKPVRLRITDETGRIISDVPGNGLATAYEFNGRITTPGFYIAYVIAAGLAPKPFKMIIAQ